MVKVLDYYWRDVASWCFEYPLDESYLSFEVGHDGFYPMMKKVYGCLVAWLPGCLVALEKYQLLFNRYRLVEGEKKPIKCRLDSFENFIFDSQKLRNSDGKYYFNEEGEGILLSQSGKPERYDNVVTLFMTPNPITIFVNIHSTAFLPYTLGGYPQKEVYSYNAPRLTQAMLEIEQCLGIHALDEQEIDDGFSKYCTNVKGYRLVNFIDEDDGTIVGLTESGHVLDEDKIPKVPIDPEYLKGLI